jgi:dTDP-L-rhamnose 4-epimerase
MMKNVLILGGGGFIGSNLCIQLVAKGYKVTILDSFSKQVHGEDYKSGYLYNSIPDGVEIVEASVLDESVLLDLLQKNEIVYHMISETGTAQSMYKMRHYVDVNIGSISILMDLLINHSTKVKKIFLASSRAVYGEGRYTNENLDTVYPDIRSKSDLENSKFDLYDHTTNETLSVHPTREYDNVKPVSIYGFSKYAQEQLLKITCETYGIHFCILRFQNVFGPGQSLLNSYTGVLNVFASRALLDKAIDIFEDGKGLRDFVYIDDAVDASILALENSISDNKTYNVGTGEGQTIMQAAMSLSKCLHKEVVCNISGNYRFGDIRHSIADIHLIQKDLNYYPKHSFAEGLKLFIDWVYTQDLTTEQSDMTYSENYKKGILRIKR